MSDPIRPGDCAVCGEPIIRSRHSYVWHQRLDVGVHEGCPKTDVRGEDITTHTVLWVGASGEGDGDA